jgi:transcriptional regulator with XRE-family HTH domain
MEIVAKRTLQVRKYFKLNQSQFAEKLGLKHGIVSMWERSAYHISDQNIKLICSIYHISEKWLRHGEGEMFDYESSSNGKSDELIKIFNQMIPIMQEAIIENCKNLLLVQQKIVNP